MSRGLLIAVLSIGSLPGVSRGEEPKKHALPAPKKGGVMVGLCDGETALEVSGLEEGRRMSRAQAQSVSDELMRAWRKKHPDAHWDEAMAQSGKRSGTPPEAGQSGAPSSAAAPGRQAGIYTDFTERDRLVWARTTEAFVDEGKGLFHSAEKLGGTIGVSCDMCHPNAANTHPETYPKYQVQLQRVAMLRDMINWCIENPLKGRPLDDGDRRMKALEAYILAQRRGIKLDYGRH